MKQIPAPSTRPLLRPKHPDDLRPGFRYAVAHKPRPAEPLCHEHRGQFRHMLIQNGKLFIVLDVEDGELDDDQVWVDWKNVVYVERI